MRGSVPCARKSCEVQKIIEIAGHLNKTHTEYTKDNTRNPGLNRREGRVHVPLLRTLLQHIHSHGACTTRTYITGTCATTLHRPLQDQNRQGERAGGEGGLLAAIQMPRYRRSAGQNPAPVTQDRSRTSSSNVQTFQAIQTCC